MPSKSSEKPVVIDFETLGIEARPYYPPPPVGVSIKYPGKKARYYAFGHPTNNNCQWSEAKEAVRQAYEHKDGVLFQNGKFDVDVAEVHMGLPVPHWTKIHDTLFLIFLDDPNQTELGLKPAATRLLDMPPDEQDAVADWLLANQPVPGVKISKSKNSEHYFGRYIAYAPGDLVGKYADGDVIRTEMIFYKLRPSIHERGMDAAYDRERQLMPILLEMERQGVPVDLKHLAADVAMYNETRAQIDLWIIKQLKASPDINLNSGDQLIEALVKVKKVDVNLLPLTATGKYQTNKEALMGAVTDKVMLGMLKYRAQLATCLDTFMVPWLKMAEASGGLIYTTWNQVKSPSGDHTIGTRTGRLSSTPNFQNIANEFKVVFDGPGLPKSPIKLPALPKVRSYITPFPGEILIDRDYSQQEPRILGHFEGGALMDKYVQNPWIDFHDNARDELANVGKVYDRKPVKNTNLGLIYGMGVAKLALKNDMPVDESKELKKAILNLYPGLKEMYEDMKSLAKMNQPIRTWGGREYYCEPPKLVEGRMRTFDYKMVNTLIQGSAADCTKEAIIRFHAAKKPDTKILLNVHDQLTASTPKVGWKQEMEVMRERMESVEFDVPILSEGAVSDTNWDQLKDYDKKGKVL
jgi:DNA polymerase I-like protein with 3'-5' exonuclease and polymerase domains